MKVKDFVDVYQKGNSILRAVINGGEIESGFSAYMRNYYADYDIDNITVGEDGYIVLYISKYKKCDSYRTKKVRRYLTEYEKGFYAALHGGAPVDYIVENKSYCIGTKECEFCTCGGDKRKCDFYRSADKDYEKETN